MIYYLGKRVLNFSHMWLSLVHLAVALGINLIFKVSFILNMLSHKLCDVISIISLILLMPHMSYISWHGHYYKNEEDKTGDSNDVQKEPKQINQSARRLLRIVVISLAAWLRIVVISIAAWIPTTVDYSDSDDMEIAPQIMTQITRIQPRAQNFLIAATDPKEMGQQSYIPNSLASQQIQIFLLPGTRQINNSDQTTVIYDMLGISIHYEILDTGASLATASCSRFCSMGSVPNVSTEYKTTECDRERKIVYLGYEE
ncbi:hypothetical protein ACJX0J_006582 [Zea mays]